MAWLKGRDYINDPYENTQISSGTFTQIYKLKPMTPEELTQTSKGRNRSKQPSELPYYLLVILVGLIVGVAIVDLVVNFRIV
jgi:type VI protein secretion system component VasF